MKESILGAIAFVAVAGMSLGRCGSNASDQGDASGDTAWDPGQATIVPDTLEYVEPSFGDAGLSGMCEPGASAGFKYLRIDDAAARNFGAEVCDQTPGTDVDAVGLRRDGQVIAWAATVQFVPWADVFCPNAAEDENSVLGPQDGSEDTGFFSLNGGHIVVSFEGEEEVQCGDSLSVVVMENPERSDYYRVYAGPTEDGPWWRFASAATGTTEVVVEWEW